MAIAMERSLGFEPIDREFDKLGYNIENRIPGSGRLRFIEVKGRVSAFQREPDFGVTSVNYDFANSWAEQDRTANCPLHVWPQGTD